MSRLQEFPHIEGVCTVSLKVIEDERGRFTETFRKEWFPCRSWNEVQTNRSESKKDVLRGLHYHRRQADYWYVVSGQIRAGLYDFRPWSSTYGAIQTLDLADRDHTGLFIPVGVAHGFLALTDVTLTYVVDRYYDSGDEFGIAWNDPTVNMPWGLANPVLSPRDARNPRLESIPSEDLPQPE
jgi:dTDP-4-dehydrorhamnose 3,5-epimerase